MKTRTLLWIVSAMVLAHVAAAETRPNIICLMTDDQTIGALGCCGSGCSSCV